MESSHGLYSIVLFVHDCVVGSTVETLKSIQYVNFKMFVHFEMKKKIHKRIFFLD